MLTYCGPVKSYGDMKHVLNIGSGSTWLLDGIKPLPSPTSAYVDLSLVRYRVIQLKALSQEDPKIRFGYFHDRDDLDAMTLNTTDASDAYTS